MKFLKNKQKNRGFVIMVAVLVSSMLISIGTFIAIIALKELQLSSSSKDSQKAFYAADSAIECALYHDIRTGVSNGPFPANSTDVANMGVSISPTVNCNGIDWQIWHSGSETPWPTGMDDIMADADEAVSYFEISFFRPQQGEIMDNRPYARVRIEKEYNEADEYYDTILQAYGHNKQSGAGIVERALKVTY